MSKYKKLFNLSILAVIVIIFSGCATCQPQYHKSLSDNPRLAEANISYKKAIRWAAKGDCEIHPFNAKEDYRNASSYLSDTIFKLKQLGHDNNIDVSEEIYYCESLKNKIHEDTAKAEKALLP
ncbi:MAG: hypothetical protein PHP17_04955 [Candidatus Omnitrophica bacterium]|nr:hypothetical protein [Candidatus Omnitrophota bacterium]